MEEKTTATDAAYHPPIRKAFEYSYQNIGANVDTLNKFGAEGWEIVIIDRSWVLFKREIV